MLECHSVGILFQLSAVLKNKQDAYSPGLLRGRHDIFFLLLQTSTIAILRRHFFKIRAPFWANFKTAALPAK